MRLCRCFTLKWEDGIRGKEREEEEEKKSQRTWSKLRGMIKDQEWKETIGRRRSRWPLLYQWGGGDTHVQWGETRGGQDDYRGERETKGAREVDALRRRNRENKEKMGREIERERERVQLDSRRVWVLSRITERWLKFHWLRPEVGGDAERVRERERQEKGSGRRGELQHELSLSLSVCVCVCLIPFFSSSLCLSFSFVINPKLVKWLFPSFHLIKPLMTRFAAT